MAFVAANLYNQNSMPPGQGKYIYKSDTDDRAAVMASGYFNNIDDLQNFAADDTIMVIGDEGGYSIRVDTVVAGVITTEMGPGEGVWLSGVIADISTQAGSELFMVAPFDGRIGRIKTVLEGVITVGDAVVTVEINTVAVTGLTVTIANSGSAIGDVDTAEATALNAVVEGDWIEVITDEGSTGAQRVWVYLEILPA